MLTQRGHNLIELMLTLAISCILLKLIFNIFIGANLAAQSIAEIHTIRGSATNLITLLTTDIKQSEKLTINNNVLTVSHAEFPTENIIEFGRTSITTTAQKHFQPGDLLVLSDYQHSEIIKVDKVYKFRDNQKITLTKPTLYKYATSAEISRLIVNKYFLKQTSLYLQDIKNQRSELITDISKFNISMTNNGVMGDVTIKQKTWHFFIARIYSFNRSNLHKPDRID